MGFNSAFKRLKLLKDPGNGHLNNLNDPILNVLKHLKIFLKTCPYMFRSIYIRPSSGGSWAVLYAVTKLNSVDVRSLCSCTVCGRMSLSSVVCVCAWSSCPGEI